MLRAIAVMTLVAIAAPAVPLQAGNAMVHDRCPMADEDCPRSVAFSCCEAPGQHPALTSARTVVATSKTLVTTPASATALPASAGAAVVQSTALRDVPRSRQRLAQLSFLLI
jgi:hypothetical protein